jgi:hypothetical protein
MTGATKSGTASAKRGRPVKEIDWKLAEKLAQIACTDEEIASICGVSLETFKRRKHDPDVAEILAGARARGKASLRRVQWKLAEGGNAAMAIFLGKNWLGQRDKFDDTPKEDANEKAREIAAALQAMVKTEQGSE